jgi:hypothetical protein
VVDDALRRELAEPTLGERIPVPIFRGGCGPVAGVDLRSNRAMRERLDQGRGINELR